MNKRTTKMAMVVLMLLAVSLYFVSGTYARYSSTFEGEGTVDVAEWHVSLDGEEASDDIELDLEFDVQNNTNVVSGKIAPGVTAVATLDLDLTGTEVAVDVEAAFQDGFDPNEVLGLDKDAITFNVVTSNGTSTVDLQNDSAFTATNGKVTVTITLTWVADSDDELDTAAGIAGETLTIPVKVTAKQHI